MRPSNSGMATPGVASNGAEPGVGSPPTAARDRPDDGAWMIGTSRAAERGGVPLVAVGAAVTAGDAGAAGHAAGGEHGGDHRIEPGGRSSSSTAVAAVGAAQRVAPHARRRRAAAASMRVAQVVDELGVPGDEVGPVEDDADRAAASDRRPAGRPPDAVCRARLAAGRTRSPRAARCRRRSAAGGRGSSARRARGTRTPRSRWRSARSTAAVSSASGTGLAGEGEERDAALDARAGAARRTPPPTRVGRRAGGRSRHVAPSRSRRPVERSTGWRARTGGKSSGSASSAARRASSSVSALVMNQIIPDRRSSSASRWHGPRDALSGRRSPAALMPTSGRAAAGPAGRRPGRSWSTSRPGSRATRPGSSRAPTAGTSRRHR